MPGCRNAEMARWGDEEREMARGRRFKSRDTTRLDGDQPDGGARTRTRPHLLISAFPHLGISPLLHPLISNPRPVVHGAVAVPEARRRADGLRDEGLGAPQGRLGRFTSGEEGAEGR